VTRGQKHFHIKDGEDTTCIEPESMNGTNDIEIHVFANQARRQALLIAKFDSLGKGASGAAVQNLMLMLERYRSPEEGGHPSGTPAIRIPSMLRSRWARNTGLSLLMLARKRAIVNLGFTARPAFTSFRASSRIPRCARQPAR
jgi:hypothetical protein